MLVGKKCWLQKMLVGKKFLVGNFFCWKTFLVQKKFPTKIFFRPKKFPTKIFFQLTFFPTNIFFQPKTFSDQKYVRPNRPNSFSNQPNWLWHNGKLTLYLKVVGAVGSSSPGTTQESLGRPEAAFLKRNNEQNGDLPHSYRGDKTITRSNHDNHVLSIQEDNGGHFLPSP